MKALLISVGTGTRGKRDAAESIAKALAHSIKHHNPDKTFFIATKQSLEITLPYILKNFRPTQYETFLIEDPENVQAIYENLRPKIQQIRKAFDQLTFDYTSGTKAMTAALSILATIYEANELSYITGKRKDGIVQPGTEQIIPIRPYFATAEQKIRMAIQFFNKAQYSITVEILNQIIKTKDPTITERVKPLLNLAKAYALWDKFQHRQAFNLLRKIKIPKLSGNKQFLGQLINKTRNNQEPEPYLIADIINNAKRRAEEEEKYDDAIARLYRTIELIGQYTLKTKYGLNAHAVKAKEIPQELTKKWGVPQQTETLKLSLQKIYELLKAKNDELGNKYCEDKELKNLLSKRNASILAHGLTPVTPETYRKFNQKAMKYAKAAVKNIEELIEISNFIKWKE